MKRGPRSPGEWRELAACRGKNPALFFPENTAKPDPGALALCSKCTVKEACLEFAIRTHQDHGVWGGLGEDERRIYRRRARAAQRRDDRSAAS
jgi:WhiB family redox-sensing transcriptional regulator